MIKSTIKANGKTAVWLDPIPVALVVDEKSCKRNQTRLYTFYTKGVKDNLFLGKCINHHRNYCHWVLYSFAFFYMLLVDSWDLPHYLE